MKRFLAIFLTIVLLTVSSAVVFADETVQQEIYQVYDQNQGLPQVVQEEQTSIKGDTNKTFVQKSDDDRIYETLLSYDYSSWENRFKLRLDPNACEFWALEDSDKRELFYSKCSVVFGAYIQRVLKNPEKRLALIKSAINYFCMYRSDGLEEIWTAFYDYIRIRTIARVLDWCGDDFNDIAQEIKKGILSPYIFRPY